MTQFEHDPGEGGQLYGLMAEFESPTELVTAARTAREQGYSRMDAYSPYPMHELAEALGLRRTRLPLLVLAGGILGCATGLFLQWYSASIDYPLNVGGRPL
ncbi:MAG: DUF3341 domain-containing protein, partial [Thermoanaerobaculia bacterium]